MVEKLGQPNEQFRIRRTEAPPLKGNRIDSKRLASASFDQVLKEKIRQEVRLSAHAQSRLRESEIELTNADMERLNGAVSKAEAKGARESLILMDNLALVVSIRNRTVITAVPSERIRENVFTNIDSAVIT